MKTDKQSLLKFAEQNGWLYPKEKVILLFTLCGGAVGGFVLGIFIGLPFIISIDIDDNIKILREFLFFIIGITSISILVGGIPALLIGIYLAMTEFIIANKKDYLLLLLIGGMITVFICLILIFVLAITNKEMIDGSNTVILLILLILFLSGGLSAMICGKLFLPKLPKNF